MTNKTSLYENHVKLNAQMVDFGGWLMPVRYTGDKEEHFATREHAGLFDVSHMGEVFLRGPKAVQAADKLLTNNISKLKLNQACYSVMLDHDAKIIDDVIAYKLSEEEILICINAGNRDKDHAWIKEQVENNFSDSEVRANIESDSWGQIALQGPKAQEIFLEVFENNLELWPEKLFYFKKFNNLIIARTGYTGEDGVEIFCPADSAPELWEKLLDIGQKYGLKPCGLSARDSLRLEAGLCLYGNDISQNETPKDANLMWVVKLDKIKKSNQKFIGQEALENILENRKTQKKLVGLKILGRGIARHGYEIFDNNSEDKNLNNKIGLVTSGTQSPSLNMPIAMAYVNLKFLENKNKIFYVQVRNRFLEAEIVNLPFYKRRT